MNQLLDLIPRDPEWCVRDRVDEIRHGCTDEEEEKLELRLAPPGAGKKSEERFEEDEEHQEGDEDEEDHGRMDPFFSLAIFSSSSTSASAPVNSGEEKKNTVDPVNNTATVDGVATTRKSTSMVVGWPPIRSIRKNLHNVGVKQEIVCGNSSAGGRKGKFVKVNMDGFPIGRKIDVGAYQSYAQLSSSIRLLFSGLFSGAQRVEFLAGNDKIGVTGLLEGDGGYTLVYEDQEGDRMLVGDVPWNVFVSTAKRLRVLKSSEVCTLAGGGKCRN